MQVVNNVNEYLYSKNCHEWICNAQVQIRSGGDITGDEKRRNLNNSWLLLPLGITATSYR